MKNVKIEIGSSEIHCHIEQFIIEQTKNQYSKCVILLNYVNEYSTAELKELFDKEDINIYAINQFEEKKIFSGYVENYSFYTVKDKPIVSIEAFSYAKKLDYDKKSCSFQNVKLKYKDVLDKTLENVSKASCVINKKDSEIKIPFIRYQETAWEFAYRLATHLGTIIYDIPTYDGAYLQLGSREEIKECDFDTEYFLSGIDEDYFKKGGSLSREVKADYLYYEVMSENDYVIGTRTRYQNHEMVIYSKTIEYKKESLKYYYRLASLVIEKTIPIYNKMLIGMSLPAKVLAVDHEYVKVWFDIDAEQDVSSAYSYQWAPLSGNFFYCPPKVDTKVSVYFTGKKENSAFVTNCIRTNSGDSSVFSNSSDKQFKTDYGKNLCLGETELTFENTENTSSVKKMCLGEDGIHLNTDKPISVYAYEGVEFTSDSMNISAMNEISLNQVGNIVAGDSSEVPASSVYVVNDVNLCAQNTSFTATSLPKPHLFFEDNPEEVDPATLYLNIFLKAAVATLVVVGVCAAIGLTGGAVIAGAVAVIGGMALMNAYSGNADSLGSYIIRGAVGAITGGIGSKVTGLIKFSSNVFVYMGQNFLLGAGSGFAFELTSCGLEQLFGVENRTFQELVGDVTKATIFGGIGGAVFSGLAYLTRSLFSEGFYQFSKLSKGGTKPVGRLLDKILSKQTPKQQELFMNQLYKLYKVQDKMALLSAIQKDPIKMVVSTELGIMPGDWEGGLFTEAFTDLFTEWGDAGVDYYNDDRDGSLIIHAY